MCPLQKKYGDVICIDGTLWALTYSEMGPPDSRQAVGPCDHCKKLKTASALDDLALIDRDLL